MIVETQELQISKQKVEADDDTAPELGAEFFARSERGKYFKQMVKQQGGAFLAPDVRAAFPTDEAVNAALRQLMEQQAEAQGG